MRRWNRWWALAGVALAGVALAAAVGTGLYLYWNRPPAGCATCKVTRGEFLITEVESGEVQAIRGDMIMTPPIGGDLKVIGLWPEGARVDVGNLVIQFDPARFEKEMLDEEAQLERSRADYAKTEAQWKQRLYELSRQIEQQQALLELAQLSRQRQTYGSPVDQQRAQIELEKAERALAQAKENLAAQEVVQRVDLRKCEVQITVRQNRYDRARESLEKTRIYATHPGIVVYRKIWKEGTDQQGKVAVGDNVWGGMALMDIPDLTAMQVQCLVGEMDLGRMQVGLKALVRLDAYPGPVFHGVVAKLAPMAVPQPGAPDIRVFEMLVNVDEVDDRLRPGMSAKAEVVLEVLPGVLSIPLSAVFAREGRPVVYCLRRSRFVPVLVELGQRNAAAAVVLAGLNEGDVVALEVPAGS